MSVSVWISVFLRILYGIPWFASELLGMTIILLSTEGLGKKARQRWISARVCGDGGMAWGGAAPNFRLERGKWLVLRI